MARRREAEAPAEGADGRRDRLRLNQWETLTRFLDDARVPVDNNKAENALRAVGPGKKNWLFVGNDKAGENLAGLYSLVATCQANGVNPAAYLRRRPRPARQPPRRPTRRAAARKTGRHSQPRRRPEQGRRRSRTSRSDYPPALHRGREEIRVKRATGAIHDRFVHLPPGLGSASRVRGSRCRTSRRKLAGCRRPTLGTRAPRRGVVATSRRVARV